MIVQQGYTNCAATAIVRSRRGGSSGVRSAPAMEIWDISELYRRGDEKNLATAHVFVLLSLDREAGVNI